MKKKKLLLLSVLTLSLFGCSETGKSTASKPISEAPISNKNNDSTKNSTKKTDSTAPKDSATSASAVKPDSEKPSTTVDSDAKDSTSKADSGTGSVSSPTVSPSTEESSASSDIYSSTKWKKDVVDMMVKYLGGNILPYVELGSKIIPTWDSSTSTLSIMGNITSGMTQNRLDAVKTDYEASGFTVSVASSKLTATDTAKGLTVVFYDNSGILELDATYNEPFNPASASAWPQEIIDDLNLNIGGNHAADVPFVYLGTANPTGEMSTYSKKYTITGGTWNNQITTLAETAFNAANASITDDANKWIITTGVNSYGTTFNANVTLADGTTMKVAIEAPYSSSYSTTASKAKMEITFTEAFVVPASGDWTQDVKDEFNDKADGHIIPYFYLGTLAPTVSYYSYYNEIDIKGGTWNDQIYTLCETALNNENATLTDDNLKWKITKNTSDLTASRMYADGCSLSLKLKKNSYNDQPVVEVTYAQGYNAPQGADWSATTKQNFTDHLDGNTVPYVYLGTTSETADWDDSLSMLTITGDTYFTAVLNGGLSSFQAAGWTAAIKTITEEDYYYGNYSYNIMQAEKVIDATTGSKLVATLTGSSISSYSGTVSGDCKLSIQYFKPYVAPTGDAAKWDDTTLQFMKDNLQGHTVPYVYLNTTTLKTSGISGTSATITGGLFSTAMLTAANTAYSTWTNPKIENEKFTASYKEADGCSLTVTLSKTSEGKAQLYITVSASFRADAAADWTDAMKTSMKNCLNGNTIPYIKLGIATPSATEYKSMNNITIKGSVWDDSILTLAKTDLEAAGWEAFKDAYSTTTEYLYAFTKLATNDYLALKLYKSGSGSYIDVYYYAPSTTTATKTDWSATEKTFLDSKTQNHSDKVPFFYMGDGDYTTSDATTTVGDKISGTSYDLNEVFEYYKVLKAAGYTKFSFNYFGYTSVELKAGYVDPTTGYKIDLKTDYSGYGTSKKHTIEINYTSSFQVPTGDDAKWSDDVNTEVTTFIGDNLSVPFVYLGTDNVTTKKYTSELDIVGGTWDDQILDLAYNAFSNSSDGWTVVKNNYDSQIMAFLTTPSGHNLKVIVKENYSNKAVIEIYKK